MCHHCFDTLLAELKEHKTSPSRYSIPDFVHALPNQTIECPLFVTWDTKKKKKKRSKRAGDDDNAFELRGCIGTLSPKPLVSSIGEYALISALNDRRFHPVSLLEIPHLRVGVSLLVRYEECKDCHDWNVGIHGIMIRFWSAGSEFSATYLPEVAQEQGWTRRQTITSLIRKAGYHGSVTDRLLQEIQCTRYQSSKHRLTYDEYVENLGGEDPIGTVQDDAQTTDFSPSNSCAIM